MPRSIRPILLSLAALALAACARGASEQRPAGDSPAASAPAAPETSATPAVPAAPAAGSAAAKDPGVVAAPPEVVGGAGGAGASDDLAAIRRLEAEARALARTDGCADAAQCAVAPVGVRPCGGPRTFVAYCRTATDSARLFRKLDELARRERAYNDRSGMMSTCELRVPPVPALQGGRCVAPGAAGTPGAPGAASAPSVP